MPKYNTRPRKGRLARQKAAHTRTRSLSGCFLSCSSDTAGSGTGGLHTGALDPTHVHDDVATVKSRFDERNKQYNKLKSRHKSAIQREKRAKGKIEILLAQAGVVDEQLSSAFNARDRAESTIEGLQKQVNDHKEEISTLQGDVCELEALVTKSSQDLIATAMELRSKSLKTQSLEGHLKSMRRTCDALRKRILRAQARNKSTLVAGSANAEESIDRYYLKNTSGGIRPRTRDMLRRLSCEGVATERLANVVNIVAEALGIDIVGLFSARSVARIMLEGLIQAQLQVAHEMEQAEYLTICGDGTSIKNQQHEAKAISIQFPLRSGAGNHNPATLPGAPPVIRLLGVHKAANHTAKQQLHGWISALDTCCDMYKRSPLGHSQYINSRLVARKLRGVLTDHAADQRRLHELLVQWKNSCDREVRAVTALKSMTTEEQLYALSNYLDSATNGVDGWRTLPSDQQGALMHDAWLALAAELGESEFQKLSPETQFDIDFVAWTGCCMHKELNAVKGGAAEMAQVWENLDLVPPLALRNKYETKMQSTLAHDRSNRGGIKLASLAGALFRHKDEKKGYQQNIDNSFEETYGYSKRFPDTSNTRYGSYCDAAAELLLHKEKYLELLDTTRLAKNVPEFVNIETNVSNALKDPATLTELAVLALYGQAVGHPYMRQVRTPGLNSLDLGPMHTQLKEYCRAVKQNPDILLGCDMSSTCGTFDGKQWDRPDVMYCILSLVPQLPYIRPALAAFFDGALQTWERFTVEFDDGGLIAKAMSGQRHSAWMAPTNDVSEGALGQCRQALRRAPTMTDNQRNARAMWKRNNTYHWAKDTLTSQDEFFIREEARQLDASGANRKVRSELNSALEARAEVGRERLKKAAERRSAQGEKLSRVQLLTDATYNHLVSMNLSDIDLQIDKLRQIGGNQIIRARSTIGNKQAKIKALLVGLEQLRKVSSQNLPTVEEESRNRLTAEVDPALEACGPEDTEMLFDDEPILS